MTPKELVREFIERFNQADINGLVNLYAPDALNDQVVFSEPLKGKEAISSMFELEFSRAQMVCIEEHIYECGDTAILQWRDPLGLRGCGFFQVKDDKIVHQKGYFDQLSFFKAQGLHIPENYLDA
ncbi:nuclear transport factor 2 family protein [Acaryochloris sp. IP29b_bin.137]|uniref:nuclear transport factor 2 family protein n=1 Tax=Acaryochloris sp. IP29b_bin.137 TaxID=2969217 RepID=UPI00261FFF98|nr:nuclear transport factor 2 family protein [Acaryochloris sp. IP29b_bin.137]